MKRLNYTNIAMALLLTILAVSSIRADISIFEDKISLYGYAAGSASYTWRGCIHNEPNSNTSTFALDAAKLGFAFDYSPVNARISAYVPSSEATTNEDIYLLEINASYKFHSDGMVTFGRFQSWVGYEAFDIPGRYFITAATTERLNIIPTFHEGIKYEANSGKYTYGLAILDSIYPSKDDPFAGDGDIGNGYAIEARAGYKGRSLVGNLVIGYQRDRENNNTDVWVADAYAEYIFPRTRTIIGGEFCVKTIEPLSFDAQGKALKNNRTNTYFGLITVRQKMSENNTLNFRLSAGHEKNQINKGQKFYEDGSLIYHGGTTVLFTKFSMSFNHTINKHIDFRGEASYTDYTNTHQGVGQVAKETFIGVQLVIKL